ncbi:MAG: DMT family transporter [Pseudomonadota bacterium]
MVQAKQNRPGLGIIFILFGILCISVNDLIIKELSGDYPLHQSVFLRSGIGILFSLIIVQFEGGFGILKTRNPWQHALRGLLIVIANMTYFAALAAMPLADATALFFAAPLFITLLSIPMLREKVGVMRLAAVLVGFIGVIIMQRPWASAEALDVPRVVLLLPVISAFTYAMNQIMTRKLGVSAKASAMAVYIQGAFVVVSLGFFVVAGDGRYAATFENESMVFLLRAWSWPSAADWPFFIALGVNSAAVGYCLSQAYRLADAATVAPYEYLGLPLAVFWGYVVFAELPMFEVWIGMALILGSGLFVFVREQQKARLVARAAQIKARY